MESPRSENGLGLGRLALVACALTTATGACSTRPHDPDGRVAATSRAITTYVTEAELIHSSPAGTSTPPTWNANLPKLAGDGAFLYAVHTYFTGGQNTATIRKRPAGSPGAWTTAATVDYVHQPPGIVIDTAGRLHLVFVCQAYGGVDRTCFQGGAGTSGGVSRFYHLIFSSKNADGSFRFDTYANYNEWTAGTNGYLGLGTSSSGTTWWSLAETSWARRIQYWTSGTQYGSLPPLSVPGRYLLYPIHASDQTAGISRALLMAGEFNPSSGSNAAYTGTRVYSGDARSSLTELLYLPALDSSAVTGSYPNDIAYAPGAGQVHLLNHRPASSGLNTELITYPETLSGAPTTRHVATLGTYAKLQVGSDGRLYLLAPASNGNNLRLGVSADGGATWTWHDAPISGISTGDVRFFGMTLVKPYTSPLTHDPGKLVFFFSGSDGSGLARHSYLGTISLTAGPPPPAQARIRLKSEWLSNCHTSEQQTGPSPTDGTWSSWSSPGLVTSEWDGAPWSCLTGQVASEQDSLNLAISSYYGSCSTSEVTTGLTPAGGGWSNLSPGVVTSEWDYAPWSCLQARLYSSGRRCEVRLRSEWRSDCTTGPVEASSNGGWSPWLITSEWNGAPWSCLSVRIACL